MLDLLVEIDCRFLTSHQAPVRSLTFEMPHVFRNHTSWWRFLYMLTGMKNAPVLRGTGGI